MVIINAQRYQWEKLSCLVNSSPRKGKKHNNDLLAFILSLQQHEADITIQIPFWYYFARLHNRSKHISVNMTLKLCVKRFHKINFLNILYNGWLKESRMICDTHYRTKASGYQHGTTFIRKHVLNACTIYTYWQKHMVQGNFMYISVTTFGLPSHTQDSRCQLSGDFYLWQL